MSLFVVNRHLVVLLETRESREWRELHPRARRRYSIACSCRQRRRDDGHCIHTRSFLENDVRPELWRDITAREMSAPASPETSPNRERV